MSKTWTAEDIRMGQFTLSKVGDMVRITGDYRFVDANGGDIGLGYQSVEQEVIWTALPQNMKDAFTTLHNYMKQKAKDKEGM